MFARSVFLRFGCLYCAAAFGIQAQNTGGPGLANNILTDGTIPNINRTAPADGLGYTISLQRLSHRVPREAQKEYERASKLRYKGQLEPAAAHLRRAVEIDPLYTEAVNDLGVCYARMRRVEDAREEFERAIQLDPHDWSGYFNAGLMYIIESRFQDAERSARTAANLNRSGSSTRLLLGMTLVLEDKFTDEAVRLLRKSQDDFPQSHLFLARALVGKGQKAAATSELEQYLGSKDNSARELAKSWLEALK